MRLNITTDLAVSPESGVNKRLFDININRIVIRVKYIFRASVELAKFSVIAFMLSRACRCSSQIRRKFLAAVDNRLYVSPLLIPLHFITELRRIGHDKERRSRTKEYF